MKIEGCKLYLGSKDLKTPFGKVVSHIMKSAEREEYLRAMARNKEKRNRYTMCATYCNSVRDAFFLIMFKSFTEKDFKIIAAYWELFPETPTSVENITETYGITEAQIIELESKMLEFKPKLGVRYNSLLSYLE